MDTFCRGCLVRYDESTELLQYTEKNRRLFVYSTGLQVKRTDTFTFQLCKDCYLNMKVACSFKKQCRSSDKKLKSYFALKDTGETLDLSAYLKNNDDSWTYRFPMLYGSSTPAHQKPKEDDTESSTSIRNFMTDIMPETDLLETEARIIKEVIEEEADLLDESLDSHWLQDDVSIDTNFRLDFSFSPFSTPRPGNNAPYSPSKLAQKKPAEKQNEQEHNYALSNNALDMPDLGNSSSNALIPIKKENTHIYEEAIDQLLVVNDIIKHEVVDNDVRLKCEDSLNNIDEVPEQQCIIDKNLEEALTNTNNNEFFLDELLVSPQVVSGIETPPTPLINNILFGEKLDMDETSNTEQHKYVPGLLIEKYENVVGDIEITEFDIDSKIKELGLAEIKTEIVEGNKQADEEETVPEKDDPTNETNYYCNMCSKKFDSLRQLKRHADLHLRRFTCDYCGKQANHKTNFVRHVQTHMRKKPRNLECDKCKLQFSSETTLRKHKVAHSGQAYIKIASIKKYVCEECAYSTDKASNFKIHMMRHKKIFSFACPECGKGYHRHSELVIHMRYHSGETPFKCTFCDRGYPRRDALTRHIKANHLEKPFSCEYCKTRFVNSTNLRNHHKKSKNCSKTRNWIANGQRKVYEEDMSQLVVTETTINSLKDS